MKWDDRKGKYVKPFTKKKVELLPHLYLKGYRLYWEFPERYNVIDLIEKISSSISSVISGFILFFILLFVLAFASLTAGSILNFYFDSKFLGYAIIK